MSKMGSNLRWIGVLVSVVLLCVVACKNPTEGCLDVDAVNYNVSADDPCSDCCTYPRFSLEISHRFQDSLLFSYDSTYQFNETSIDTITRFEKVSFYLSDFRLVNGDDSLEVLETIELDLLNGGTEIFKDDYTLVSRSFSSFEYDVGEIRGQGIFNTLKFTVGIVGNAEFSDAESIQIENHSLGLSMDTLWTATDGYIFNQVIVIPDTLNMPGEQRIINIKGQDSLGFVTLPYQIEVDLGDNVIIPLKIDYKEWFSGINFVGDSIDVIASKIVENTTNAFSINE